MFLVIFIDEYIIIIYILSQYVNAFSLISGVKARS